MTIGIGSRRIGIGLALAIGSAALAADRGPDPGASAKAPGRRAFEENCQICHTPTMVSRQRLTAKQWAVEVDKMIGWGAPVRADQRDDLLAYLASTFSDKAPPEPPETASPDELLAEDKALAAHPAAVGDSARGGPAFAVRCAVCHGAEGQGGHLGPRLAGRPILLDIAGYRDVLARGRRQMPEFAPILGPDDPDDILAWLRSLGDESSP